MALWLQSMCDIIQINKASGVWLDISDKEHKGAGAESSNGAGGKRTYNRRGDIINPVCMALLD